MKEVLIDHLRRFPNTPLLTLAKKIYKENPNAFKDIEACRNRLRYYAGQKGEALRKEAADKSLFRPAGDLNPFKLPESHSDPFEPYVINQSRTLILSDLHFPYQDNKAITLALKYGIEKNANCIFINGDLIDFATISRHEKDWRSRSVAEEFDAVRSFLVTLRKTFPKAKIVYKLGNHDERWEKWLYVKAPEVFDMSDFQLEIILKLGELKIDIVKDKRPVHIGKLTVFHGHEFTGGSGGVNPARATFLKSIASVLVGHYHRTTSHTEPSLNGDVHVVNSTGCLCGLNPMYMPVNKHNHGFSFCELQIKTGEYSLDNLKIVKGKIYR